MIQDWGTAIYNALANALNMILTFIPKLIGFLVILIVGLIIAALLRGPDARISRKDASKGRAPSTLGKC